MKKIMTILTASFFAVSGFAQQVIWNGEDEGAFTLWDDSKPQVVENDDKDGINPSEKCIKYSFNGDDPIKGGLSIDLQGNRRISMMIKRNGSGNVRLELIKDGDEGYLTQLVAWYDGEGDWKRLVFDYSTTVLDDTPEVLVIYADHDLNYLGDVFLDNIIVEALPIVNGVSLAEAENLNEVSVLNLTGIWMSGDCTNITTDPWTRVEYNDFAILKEKIVGNYNLTTVDLSEVSLLVNPVNVFVGEEAESNPNCLVYAPADQWFPGDFNVIRGDFAENVYLFDGDPFQAKREFRVGNITYERSCYVDGGWETIMVPFNVNLVKEGERDVEASEYTIERCESVQENLITFVPQEQLQANVPAILKFNEGREGEENRVFIFCGGEQTISPLTETSSLFKGSYHVISGENHFLLDDKGEFFGKGGEDSNVLAFRAYIDNTENGPVKYVVRHVEATNMEIQEINSLVIYSTGKTIIVESSMKESVKVYTVDGQLVRSVIVEEGTITIPDLPSGVYIVNNQKAVIR